MGIFRDFLGLGEKNYDVSDDASNYLNDDNYTLDLIKRQVDLKELKLNLYNEYWALNDGISFLQKEAQVIDNCINGVGAYFGVNLNDDLINTIVDNIVDETFKDLDIERLMTNGETEQVEELQKATKTNKYLINHDDFKTIFKYMYLYQKCLLKINVVNGLYDFEVLKPFQYKIHSNGSVKIIVGFNEYNEPIFETRQLRQDGLVNIITKDGVVESDSMLVYEFTFKSRMYNKLETLLDYQTIDSSLTKETIINLSKNIYDKNLFKGNPPSGETIQIVDVPTSISQNAQNSLSAYFMRNEGKNSLGEIEAICERKTKKVVNSFRLSRQTLGVGDSNVDFASSIIYENNMTSRTIEAIRGELNTQFTAFVLATFGEAIIFNFKQYKLTSDESITERQVKAQQARNMSTIEKVAEKLDLPIYDDRVIVEALRIKIENNIPMTLQDDEDAQRLGLQPKGPSPFDNVEEL